MWMVSQIGRKTTVVVSLWNDLATSVGQELPDMADKSPVVVSKSLRVGDFQGVYLSALPKSMVAVNPDIPEANKLRNSNPSLGEEKPAFFSIKAFVSYIKADQTMWYRACKTCNKKVTEAIVSGYWCEGCQKNDAEFSLRDIMVVKVSDASGEAWLSVFNEEAEKILGYSADELNKLKTEEEESSYQMKLKEATWVPHLFGVSVRPHEYNNEKRQRITVRVVAPVNYAVESRYLVEEVSKMKIS